MEGLRDAIDAHVPRGARVLTIGLDGGRREGAAQRDDGARARGRRGRAAGGPVRRRRARRRARPRRRSRRPSSPPSARGWARAAPSSSPSPTPTVLARDPQALAAERRRRFTRATLDAALARAGLAVTGWPSSPDGLLVARAVSGDDAAVLADLRRELGGAAQALAARAAALQDERDALQARVVALEARERELRERLLDAHELLGSRDAEVAGVGQMGLGDEQARCQRPRADAGGERRQDPNAPRSRLPVGARDGLQPGVSPGLVFRRRKAQRLRSGAKALPAQRAEPAGLARASAGSGTNLGPLPALFSTFSAAIASMGSVTPPAGTARRGGSFSSQA